MDIAFNLTELQICLCHSGAISKTHTVKAHSATFSWP